MPRVGAAVLKARYIRGPLLPYGIASTAFGAAGRVWLPPIDVPWPVIIDRIIYQVGATSAGNVRLGLYREGATADSPAGGVLVVESASVAQSTAYYLQMVTIAATVLTPGQYFVGIQGSDDSGTFEWSRDDASLLSQWYDVAGGYGAFTDPCPAITKGLIVPFIMLRVKENLPAGYRL